MKSLDDEILAEVRSIRDAHAAKFNYDIGAIVADLKQVEAQYVAQGAVCIQPPPRELLPNTALQRTRFVRR